jgi:hypothetical protein
VTLTLSGENTLTQNFQPDSTNYNTSKDCLAVGLIDQAKITIQGEGKLTATSGGYACSGIGNLVGVDKCTVHIKGGTVVATGANRLGTFPDVGIGIGGKSADMDITIDGTAHVTGNSGTGGSAAGIGSFSGTIRQRNNVYIGGNAQVIANGGIGATYSVISGEAQVTAIAANGPGIGTASGAAADVRITDNAIVFAKGAAHAPGIRGGSFIIDGEAQVTAIGSGYGAGIGRSNTTNATSAILNIGENATVRSYSSGILSGCQAIDVASITGDGYFVNAYFTDPVSMTDATTLDIYNDAYNTDGSGTKMANSPELPANYRCFAYTTKNTAAQDDWITAKTDSFQGVVLPVDGNDDNSIHKVTSTNGIAATNVKLQDFIPGTPTAAVGRNATDGDTAAFTSTTHMVIPVPSMYQDAGFRYGTDSALADYQTVSWGAAPVTATETATQTETANGLLANTDYYVQNYLTSTSDVVLSANPRLGAIVPFTTLPKITSASAAAGSTAAQAVIDADFYHSTANGGANNAEITEAEIYVSENEIEYSSDYSSITEKTSGNPITPVTLAQTADFEDDGLTGSGYTISGLAEGKTYNILVVITNAGGKDGMLTTYSTSPPIPEINVSVPIKLIFAAFETDSGTITAPNYYIRNHGEADIDVTVNGLTITEDAGLTLAGAPPGEDGQIGFWLHGTGPGPPLSDTGYLTEATSNVLLGTLTAADSENDRWNFTLTGAYQGSFAAAKKPVYVITFGFALSGP